VSDFFEPPPPPPEPEREYHPPPWLAPPPNILGAVVPLQLLLARRDALAVVLEGATAYSTGVELALSVRRPRGRTALEEPPLGLHCRYRGELPDDVLRFGIQFADGRKATSIRGFPVRPDEEPSHPVLVPRGGGGGGSRWDYAFWLYPLPPPGALAFVCEWPSEGIELTREEIDADVIRDAAERATVLWEDRGSRPGSGKTDSF
jgi:hypothetical protein